MRKIISNLINILTLIIHWIVSPFFDEEFLLNYKPVHICWWFEKYGFPIPKYFIATGGGAFSFAEPGGDADFGISLWTGSSGTAPTIVSDFVHGGHLKSLQPSTSITGYVYTPNNSILGTGILFSTYVYFNTLPSSGVTVFMGTRQVSNGLNVMGLQLTSGGILQAVDTASGSQIGSNGATLSTRTWYRISIVGTITSTTVNSLTINVNGSASITLTNVTLTNVSPNNAWIGNVVASNTCDMRFSDIYCWGGSSFVDGNFWVTAKRPYSNGTTNGFTTQIGSGGSGYGSGHAPQVNERPLNTSNGWSMVGAGSAVTEEYNVEGKSVGDIDIAGSTAKGLMGWASFSSLVSESVTMFTNGSSVSYNSTTSAATYTKPIPAAFPAGSGQDIGIETSTTSTTVSLYECGIVVAYIPAVVANTGNMFLVL